MGLALAAERTGVRHAYHSSQICSAQPALLVVVVPTQLPTLLLKKTGNIVESAGVNFINVLHAHFLYERLFGIYM